MINTVAEILAGFTFVALLAVHYHVDLESALCFEKFGQTKASVTVEKKRTVPHKGVVPNRILVRCK